MPIGAYLSYPSQKTVPAGFLLADGRSLKKSEYPELFNVLGYIYGGSGENFNLPNFADGKFMRGIGGNAAALGTAQQDAINTKNLQIRSITTDNVGTRYIYGTNTTSDFRGVAFTYSNTGSDLEYKSVAGKDNADIFSSTKKADETRPYNMAVVVIIKVKNVNTPTAGQIDKTILATEAKSGIVKLKNAITAKQEDAAVTEKAVSDAIEANKGLGIEQEYKNVTSQRNMNEIYENTTDKPIYIYLLINNAYKVNFDVLINNKKIITHDEPDRCIINFIVPPKATYKIIPNSTQYAIVYWDELR